MSNVATEPEDLKGTGYELFVAALSVLSIVNLVLIYVIDDEGLTTVLRVTNAILSVIFFTDFVYRLLTARSKRGYFFRQFGWADLLASLPLQHAKVLRVFRLWRVVRVLRSYGALGLGRALVRDLAGSALFLVLLIGVLVIEFGSLGMLHLESGVDGSNIDTASDAVWYVLVTMSTVGYGDQFPVSNAGRILGSWIIVLGVAIFGSFTGYLANVFLSPRKEPSPPPPDDPLAGLESLRGLLAQQQAAIDELERRLQRPG